MPTSDTGDQATVATAAYGTWPSALTPDLLVAGVKGLNELRRDGQSICWLESRPSEGGRQVVMQRRADGRIVERTPVDSNARTRVHEYGGGSYLVADDVVWFTEFSDQRIHRIDAPGSTPRPITPAPTASAALRYADLQVTPDRRWLIAVRERHEGPHADEVFNELVALLADGTGDDEVRVIAHGWDFVASPRLSPDGRQLAFIAWNHPNMPWDDTELLRCDIHDDGLLSCSEPVTVAGGTGASESVIAPAWSPESVLHAITDVEGWWNLHRFDADGTAVNLADVTQDLGSPPWQLGASLYDFLADGRVAVIATDHAVDRPSLLDPDAGTVEQLPVPHTSVRSLLAGDGEVIYLGGAPAHPDALVRCAVPDRATDAGASDDADGRWTSWYASRDLPVDASWLSQPEVISFPTTDGMTAHGLYHRPRNPRVVGPTDERPPLIVLSHGGPTGHVSPRVELGISYWTSRGFAVVDVNYRGSSGFGRAYREALRGRWGIVDVDDCVAAATALTERGEVDGNRLVIKGGSAGGFTTLAALTFRDVFAAGASYFGVADLGALAAETHKFESRYLDRLVGPYPREEARYRERSPVHHADGLSCPVILLQGLLDRIVPPAQAEAMIAAMAERGVPYAYVTFEDEDHGFRRAENVIAALQAEQSFYSQVLDLETAEDIEPVTIVGLRS